ncbi:MAG: hypothetical protein OSB47_14260, partial [Pirellulaceae bacterium]|nr:hypothetical protein [Pirellulaceae bacterium]
GQQPGAKLNGKADKRKPSGSAEEKQDLAAKEKRIQAATVSPLAQQGPQDLEPSRLRVVLIVRARSGPASTVSDQPDAPVKKSKSPK